MPPKASPTAHAWTLRFKKHTTTTYLLVQASQSFDSIKEELLTAIKATGRQDFNGVPLPSDSKDIILGVPIDRTDLLQGWVDLLIPEAEGHERLAGKVKKGSVLNGTPLGAGLKDEGLLAFKFAGEGEDWDVRIPSYDEEDAMDRIQAT